MTKSFNCASCSAPLEFEGKMIQKCRYCGSSVIAPTELFYGPGAVPMGDISSLTGKALKLAEINKLIHRGEKIEAIKLFRETFGVGLAEAKDAVERMERGESVDVSGMRVQTNQRAALDPKSVDAIKKIGFTIGGSVLVTFVLGFLIVAGAILAVFYFTWSAIEKASIATNSANVTTSPAQPTPTPDATQLLKIGGEGTGAGRFKDNRHVAVDGRGRIFSSDYSPHRIQVFDASGNFQKQWAPEAGSNLYDLAADFDGNVYIANDRGIFKHEGETGKLVAKMMSVYPTGMALMWNGNVVVTVGKAIIILDPTLKVLNEFKNAGDLANTTSGFNGVATDGSGNIYVIDNHNDDVCKFSSDGRFLNRFASGARSPNGIAVDPRGWLYVSDTSEIKVLDENGKAIRTLDANQAFGLAFDQTGDLYVASRPYVFKYKLNF